MKNALILFSLLLAFQYSHAQTKDIFLNIDYAHPKIGNEGTNNIIGIYVYDNNDRLVKSLNIKPTNIYRSGSWGEESQGYRRNLACVYLGEFSGKNGNIKKIMLTTNGTDAFFIDQLVLTKNGAFDNVVLMSLNGATDSYNQRVFDRYVMPNPDDRKEKIIRGGEVLKKWGTEGFNGWCMSLDANDANGNWSDRVNGCFKALVFNVNTGKVRKVSN